MTPELIETLHAFNLVDELALVEDEAGVEAVETVTPSGVRDIIYRAVVLKEAPLVVARQHHRAFGNALLLDGVQLRFELLPGRGGLVEAGSLKVIAVVKKDRR